MCLLEEVIEWDDRSIVCLTNSHRTPENPLRRNDQLSILHAFEYGAQAAAIHGGLCARAAGTSAAPGYLAAIRDATVHASRLDDIALPLTIEARQLFGDAANNVYECRISAGDSLLADARITIVQQPNAG
jgi:predicted hotdog family 3-hydroxylacyl-ACP dehydratase